MKNLKRIFNFLLGLIMLPFALCLLGACRLMFGPEDDSPDDDFGIPSWRDNIKKPWGPR